MGLGAKPLVYMNSVNLMHVDRLRLQTYEQYCAGDESCDQRSSGQRSSGQLTSGQRSSGQLSTGQLSSGQLSSGQRSSGQRSSGQLSSGQLYSGQRSSGQLSSGHRQTDRCLDALVNVHGSVLTVGCVCSTQDNGSYSTCDAARKRLPHKLSPCAGNRADIWGFVESGRTSFAPTVIIYTTINFTDEFRNASMTLMCR